MRNFTPVRRASISPVRCPIVPLPGCAIETASAFILPAVIMSPMLRKADLAGTTMSSGCVATSEIGAKSRSDS